MRRTVLGLVLLLVATVASGQTSQTPLPIPLPPLVVNVPFPIPYPVSLPPNNSVIDHQGNLLLFDISFTLPPATPDQPRYAVPKLKTHVTVISPNGSKKGFDYEGGLQAIGAGRRAVYAIVSTYTATPGPVVPAGGGGVARANSLSLPVYMDRQLVALNVVAGTLPALLPSFAPLNLGEVKVAAIGAEGEPDSIAIIEPPGVIGPLPADAVGTFTVSHLVRLLKFDGASFKDVKGDRILVP